MLSCGNVGKIYSTERGAVAAVRGIDLDVPRGQFAAIVGRSPPVSWYSIVPLDSSTSGIAPPPIRVPRT